MVDRELSVPRDAGTGAAVDPVPGAEAHDDVRLSEEEERRFSALVRWSYGDDWFAVQPHLDVESDTATLVLRGEVDAVALGEVRSLIELVIDSHPTRLRVDLTDAIFVSVSTMLCLLDASNHIREVVVERPSPTVRRIFDLVDPDRRLAVES